MIQSLLTAAVTAAGVWGLDSSNAGAAGEAPPPLEWRVNEFTFSAQAEPALAVLGDDRVVVVWSSRRQKDGRSAIFGREFTLGGEPRCDEAPVSLWAQTHQIAPDVAAGPDGSFWVVWQSHAQDGDGASIVARRFDAAFRGGSEMIVNQQVEGDQTGPVIAISRAGDVAIAWTTADLCTGRSEVRLRMFHADGRPIGDEFGLPDGTPGLGATTSPALAFGEDGTLAVAHAAWDEANRPRGIVLCRFDPTGCAIGAAVDVPGGAPGWHPIEPAVSAFEDGWIVGWHEAACGADVAEATGYEIVLQRLNGDGERIDEPRRLARPGDSLGGLALGGDPARRRFIALWNGADEDGGGIFAQWFAAQAMLDDQAGAFRLTRTSAGEQALRQAAATNRIAVTSSGSVICAWSGNADKGDSSGVHVTCAPAAATSGRASSGVLAAAKAAGSDGLQSAIFGGDHTEAPQPHEPPIFDPRTIESGRREVVQGLVDIGFTGIFNTGWTPPDPHMAAGPDHLVLMTNGAIAFMTKTGVVQFQQAIEGAAGFWGSVGAANFVFDPEVLYDPLSGRFFAMASDGATSGQSFVLVAVSDDSNPNGTWFKYRFSTTALSGDTFDSPNIGVSSNVVYISGDRTDATTGHPVFTYDKASLLAGQPPAITRSLLMPTSVESAGIPPVWFDNPPALYAIEHGENVNNSTVRLLALNDPLGTPTFSSTVLPVGTYGQPEDPPQMGTTVRPETFDARFWSVAYVNGSLWATHHAGNPVRVRWYQIAMNGWPTSGQNPQLVQSGIINPSATVRTFFSAITADAAGNAALVFARSSPSEFISMCTAFRSASDPLGTFQPMVIRQVSTGPYTTNRWGDYAAITLDPADPSTIWAHHEYAVNNVWRTWVTGFSPLPPAPPNNDCANATIIGAGSHAFSTLHATTDGPDEPAACNSAGFTNISNDVWYRYLSQCDGVAVISLCDADFNAKAAAYASCPGGPGQALACDDDSCGDDPILSIPVSFGQQMHIRIGGVSGATGSGTLLIECTVPCPADVTNSGAVDVGDLLAVIGAWGPCANPNDCPADIDGDDMVGVSDLLAVINAWGPCP